MSDRTDDTDGNMIKGHVVDGVENHDTEGQGFKMKSSDGVDDDTEGSGMKFPAPEVADTDDTDGHSVRTGHVAGGVETDDTEGNAFRH